MAVWPRHLPVSATFRIGLSWPRVKRSSRLWLCLSILECGGRRRFPFFCFSFFLAKGEKKAKRRRPPHSKGLTCLCSLPPRKRRTRPVLTRQNRKRHPRLF